MIEVETKASLSRQSGLSRMAFVDACIDEIIDYQFKEERNWFAIRRNFIIAITICVVALIVEIPVLLNVGFGFFGLWGYSLFKGIKIQKKITELRKELDRK